MGYVSRSLAPGEQIVFEGQYYWLKRLLFLFFFWWPGTWGAWGMELVVTNRRLIYKRGLIAVKTEELSLQRIEEINVRQSILGRIFGYGEVVCHGTGGGQIATPSIASPGAFRRALQEAQARRESE